MLYPNDDSKEEFFKENVDNARLKKQIKGAFFLFICFVVGFLVTFALVKFI